MEDRSTEAIQVFYSYSDTDEFLRNELEKHLIILSRQGLISNWHHRKILAGKELKNEVDMHMKVAQLILLLVSPDFLASDYCYEFEMELALRRHKSGEALIIPILLRPVDWQGAPFSRFEALPLNRKPITSWAGKNGRDKAFLEIALGIRSAVSALKKRKKEPSTTMMNRANHVIFVDFHVQRAGMFYGDGRYQEAVAIYEQALKLDPTDVVSLSGKGDALYKLQHYQEAVASYEQALKFDPTDMVNWSGKGDALYKLQHYQEAVASYEQALKLDPTDMVNWSGKGDALYKLQHYQEAVASYEQALKLSSYNTVVLDSLQKSALYSHYVDKLSELLREGQLRESEPNSKVVGNIARLWTLTILYLVGKNGKENVLKFLSTSDLIDKDNYMIISQGADFSKADLQGATLQGATLRGTDLRGADFSKADLRGADFSKADLRGANLYHANLGSANLCEANLKDANLRRATLIGARLNDTQLLRADLREALLRDANLQRANLQRADLRNAYLQRADLRNANLEDTNLWCASLQDVSLKGANLKDANLFRTVLTGIDLEETQSLQGALMPNGQKHH